MVKRRNGYLVTQTFRSTTRVLVITSETLFCCCSSVCLLFVCLVCLSFAPGLLSVDTGWVVAIREVWSLPSNFIGLEASDRSACTNLALCRSVGEQDEPCLLSAVPVRELLSVLSVLTHYFQIVCLRVSVCVCLLLLSPPPSRPRASLSFGLGHLIKLIKLVSR